ncbi:MAG: ABC transporter ATP-binding protein/permease [Rickettsiales bacterium]|nr:ABC transporter ATP-binding protein/permease [Rickettsiales bacterium]
MKESLWGFYREMRRKHRGYAITLSCLKIVQRAISIAFYPFMIGRIYSIFDYKGPDFWNYAVGVLGMVAAVQLGRYALDTAKKIFEDRRRPLVSSDIAIELSRRIFTRDYEFFISKNVGSIQSQAQKIRDGFHTLAIDFFSATIGTVLGVLAIVGMLLEIDRMLAAIIIGNGIIIILFRLLVMKKSGRLFTEASKAGSKVSGKGSDAIANWQNVKIFSGALREMELERDNRRLWIEKKWRAERFELWTKASWWMVDVMVAWIGTIGYSIWLFHEGRMSVGGFALALNAFSRFENEFKNLGETIKNANEARAEARQAWDEIMVPAKVLDRRGAKDLVVRRGEIRVEKIDFSYGKNRLFRDFSLKIKPGESVGIIGESGAGKTTLSALLLRLFDVDKGAILIDGQDIKKVRQDSLRDSIAFVPQDAVLFNRTIKDNIGYARPGATDAEIEAAAKAASIHDFIMTTARGYDTMVGNRGIKLSGGQRQRIAIARAVLKNAKILILDEATSSLDSATEAGIQKSLDDLIRGRTTIAIAHRLSTLAKMDRIVVIENGRIARQGTPAEML